MLQGEAVTLFVCCGLEMFVGSPRAWQCGFWFDSERGQWAQIGLGRLMVGITRV